MATNIFEQIDSREELIWQLPGYVGYKDKQSKIIAANKNITRLIGYHSLDDVIGLNDYEIHCNAVNAASFFIKQDKKAMKNGLYQFIESHRYADDCLHIFFTTKSPLKSSKGLIDGVICNAAEITTGPIFNLVVGLFKTNKFIQQIPNCDSQFYEFGSSSTTDSFTPRESEIIFYLIRGKSYSKIGKLLYISKRTVETHVDNMKIKHNLNSKSELIEFSINQGLAYFIPESLLKLALPHIPDTTTSK